MEKTFCYRQINYICFYLVISDQVKRRRRELEILEEELVKSSNKPSTQTNIDSHIKRYKAFCTYSTTKLFPVTEFKLCKYAAHLSKTMKTVESIKSYCSTICQENELRGYRPVRRGVKYYKTLQGIRNKLRHQVRRAQPMTVKLLKKIESVVNIWVEKELVIWVAILCGFFLVLRKSNLVPIKRAHDMVHNITRCDVRYGKGVVVLFIRWTKTNQNREKVFRFPMVANRLDAICPARWLMFMVNSIPAHSNHNLFSFMHRNSRVLPVTYRDLMVQLRAWLKQVGVQNERRFSSHSLRRGGSTHLFKSNVPDKTIMTMGDWSSQCYKNSPVKG